MPAARPLQRLSPESAAYVAGLIDGEGTITLTRLHAGEHRRLVISIASTEREILDFAHREIGAGKVTRKRTQLSTHTPSFCYAITSRQALGLLAQVVQHLRSYKRYRAQLALNKYTLLTPRNGKYPAGLLATREKFVSEFLSLKPGMALTTSPSDPRRA